MASTPRRSAALFGFLRRLAHARVALAGVLFAQPDLLLLETARRPTNYLDLEGALWLESYPGEIPP
ncbi:MAG: hypothetical protein R3D53_13385 [Paracoccaceae bacterium]